MSRFYIEFLNNQRSYFMGQPIVGRVVMSSNESRRFRSIKVSLRGEAIVDADNRSGQVRRSSGKVYELISPGSVSMLLWEGDKGDKGDKGTISPGDHYYDFTLSTSELTGLPASVEETVGCIRYTVCAVADRVMGVNNTAEEVITLVPAVDVNSDAFNRTVLAQNSKATKAVMGLLSSGTIKGSLQVHRSGFLPGDTINVQLSLENSCIRTLVLTPLSLTKRIIVRTGGGHTKTFDYPVVSIPVNESNHLASQKSIKNMFNIVVPSVPPTASANGFSCTYFVKIIAAYDYTKLLLEAPITIATFRGGVQAPPPPAPYGQAPPPSAPYGQAPPPSAPYGQAPPPAPYGMPYGQGAPAPAPAPYGQAPPPSAPYGQAPPPPGQGAPYGMPYGQGAPAPAPYDQAPSPQGAPAPVPYGQAPPPQGAPAPAPYDQAPQPQGAPAPAPYGQAPPPSDAPAPVPYGQAPPPQGAPAPVPYGQAPPPGQEQNYQPVYPNLNAPSGEVPPPRPPKSQQY